MSYILIPQIVSDTTAMIWVGAVDEKVRINPVALEYNIINETKIESLKLSPSEWRSWKTRHPLERLAKAATVNAIHYQRVTIGLNKPLLPRTKYVIRLMVGDEQEAREETLTKTQQGDFQDYNKIIGEEVVEFSEHSAHLTKATVTTLPSKIPASTEPFIVMLGSCFYLPNDSEGLVGETFMKIPDAEKPEIKFLCGDQVYLDNPWQETTWNVALARSPKENMRSFFFEKYLKTWTQVSRKPILDENGLPKERAVGGFNLLLRNGANYFCSDDHEFWNNAPNFGGAGAVLTFFKGQRRWWFREASELFRIFQSLASWMTFDVPPLSFCIADTRINRLTHNIIRDDKAATFVEEDDLEAIGEWIKNLNGPGVLVMGQILLSRKANFKKTFGNLHDAPLFTRFKESFSQYFDFGLPDFPDQYEKLCGYIKNSKHSIVVLSGDVHFGRISVCDLNADEGIQLVEIISSPLSVVSISDKQLGRGTYEDAPAFIENIPVISEQIAEQENHFVTIEFSQNADAANEVNMKVKAWNVLKPESERQPGEIPQSVEIKTITLK